MKRTLSGLFLVIFLVSPKAAFAQQYGQGTVLGEEEKITHVPVEAGLAENVAVSSFIMLGASYLAYKRATRKSASVRIK
jgi:hypothetical protein